MYQQAPLVFARVHKTGAEEKTIPDQNLKIEKIKQIGDRDDLRALPSIYMSLAWVAKKLLELIFETS